MPRTILKPEARLAVKREIFGQLGYVPTPEQGAFHFDLSRVKLVAGGEQGGKSYCGAKELVSDWPNGVLYWIVGQSYDLARKEFSYVADDLSRLGVVKDLSFPKEGKCSITTPICTIETKSADDVITLAAESPDGILACEAAQMSFEAFQRLRGRVARSLGWLALTGTFERSMETSWYAELFTRWQGPNADQARSFSLPSWSNTYAYPGGEQDPEMERLRRTMDDDRFVERHGGRPCPPTGLVFKEFQTHIHVGHFPFQKNRPVYLWIDPGYAGAYAVEVAQVEADTVYLVDEIYAQALTTEEIITVAQKRPWIGAVEGGAIDVAGRQHQGLASVEEVWRKLTGIHLNAQKVGIVDGIDRLHTFLKPNPLTGKPGLFVDGKCRGFIAENGGGPNPVKGIGVYKYKTGVDNTPLSDLPDDKNNHATKAVIYGLVDHFGLVTSGRNRGHRSLMRAVA